jgi:hypothetical protein
MRQLKGTYVSNPSLVPPEFQKMKLEKLSDLERRALRAHVDNGVGHLPDEVRESTHQSKRYVILRRSESVLAVYRIRERQEGQVMLSRLKRPPKKWRAA